MDTQVECKLKLELHFHSSYFYEAFFSTSSLIKNKQQNRLANSNAPMIIMALTAFKPNIDKLFSDMLDQGIDNLDRLGDNNGNIFKTT